jgi:hypothetical protein
VRISLSFRPRFVLAVYDLHAGCSAGRSSARQVRFDCTDQIVDLTWGEHQVNRVAHGINERMDLVLNPPRDRPIACSPFFSRTGTVLVSTPDGGVDHHVNAKDYRLPRRSAFTATNATQRRWRFAPPEKNQNHFGAVASVVAMIADAVGSGVDVARLEGSRGRLRLRSVIYRAVR